jgi:polar amino acid transport system substrate-binding protein
MDARKAKQSAKVVAGAAIAGGASVALGSLIGPIAVLALVAPLSALAIRRGASGFDEIKSAADLIRATSTALYLHSFRSATYASAIAAQLGLRSEHVKHVHGAALVHDIGKVAIDRELLERPGPLSAEEFELVKLHSVLGEQILMESVAPPEFAKWVRHHHERIDGTGYPDGLSGEDIPIESRIIAVADAYDAMVGGTGEPAHPYRASMKSTDAIEELHRCSESQFDRKVVDAFEQVLRQGDTCVES